MHDEYKVNRFREILKPVSEILGLSDAEFEYLCTTDPDLDSSREWYMKGVGFKTQEFLRVMVLLDIYDDVSLIATPKSELRDIDPRDAKRGEIVVSDIADAESEYAEVLEHYRSRKTEIVEALERCREFDRAS